MASLIFNSLWNDVAKGNVDFDTDTFKVMFLTSSASPNKDTWTKRSNVTNEVAASGGYVAGGFAATVTVQAVDTANDRQDITLGGTTVEDATITARYAVYYKSRGGASSADELVAVVDFGSDITSTAADFVLAQSTLRISN